MNTFIVDLENKYCFPGESFKGQIKINVPKEDLKSIKYMIIPSQFWQIKTGGNGFNTTVPVSYKIKLDKLKYENASKLYSMKINIPISRDYLPCLEYNYKNMHAHVRYELKIFAENINGKEIKREMYILILSKPVLNYKIKITKDVKQSIKNFFFFEKGEVILKVILNDINFKYNSLCEFNIEIDNTKGKLATEEYKVVIIRKLNFSEIIHFKHYEDEKEIFVLKEKAKVNVGEKKSFICKFNFEDKDNNDNNKEIYLYKDIADINFFLPSLEGNVIKCEYELKISLYFENFVDYNHRPRIIIPISVVHETVLKTNNISSSKEISTGNTTNIKPKESYSSEESTKVENNRQLKDKNKIDEEATLENNIDSIHIDSDINYPPKNEIEDNKIETPNNENKNDKNYKDN